MHQPEVWTNPRGIAEVNLKNDIPRMHHAGVNVARGPIWPSAELNLPLLWSRGKSATTGVNVAIMILIVTARHVNPIV